MLFDPKQRRRLGYVLAGLFVAGSAPPDRTDLRKIGEMELTLSGVTATVDPINPVVPKNVASGVRIVVNAGSGELTAAEAETFVGGPFEILAELAGPGLNRAVTLPLDDADVPAAVANDPLILPLPALPTAGDYTLSNIRMVSKATGRPLLDIVPRQITVEVIAQVLVTSVKTRPLTLDELKARGVVLDSDDYLGFEFTLGLKLESKPINIKFPVAFDRQGVAVPQPLQPPLAPERGGVVVDLPPLPLIVPMLLETDGGSPPEIELPGGGKAEVRIPSVLVIPGQVGFLKQFFSAMLFVSNGAPADTPLVVRDIEGTIKLPPGPDLVPDTSDDPLALPELETGIQETTLSVVGVGADGELSTSDDENALRPGEQAQAEFLLRGEAEGFHQIDFDIKATLEGLVTGPVDVFGKASGGVLVRNPFFDVTFAVPSVVRDQEDFSLFVTVTNIGESFANDLSVSFEEGSISGVELIDDATKSIDTLNPRESEAFEFRFKSLRTGKVVANYLKLEGDQNTGKIRFTLGVGERGVPLSPDTLVLPAPVAALEPPPASGLPSVVRAAMRVLGQGWSISNAPAGTLPPSVERISNRVVLEKALALAEAGLRVELGQERADAMRDLLTDFVGGTPLDAGFDQLMRETNAGRNLVLAVGQELRAPALAAGGPVDYERETAQLYASGPDFLSVAIGSGSARAPVNIVLSDAVGNASEAGATVERAPSAVEGAVFVPLGDPETAPVLGLISDPSDAPYGLELRGQANGTVELALTFARGDGTFLRSTSSFEVTDTTTARIEVDPFRPDDLLLAIDTDGDGLFEAEGDLAQETLSPVGPRLISATVIGPEVLDGASDFGFHTAVLFDRIVSERTANDVSNYEIPDNGLKQASRELSGRLVLATLEQPEGPNIETELGVSGIADERGVVAPPSSKKLQAKLTAPGAVVTGRVFNADGSPLTAGTVLYSNMNSSRDCSNKVSLVFAELPLEGGRYEFRYVRQDHCGAPFSILNVDPDSGELRKVSAFVRAPGERIELDLALFGRGAVEGTVTELGQPVPNADVVVVSQTDPQSSAATTTDGDGRYRVDNILVGPVSVKAANLTSVGSNSGRVARAGSTAIVDVLLDGGTVRATGTVRRVEAGESKPVFGATVVYSLAIPGRFGTLPVAVGSSETDGSFTLEGLPPGEYVLEAILTRDERVNVSGVSASGDTITADLALVVPEPDALGTVRGVVQTPDGLPFEGAIVTIEGRGVVSKPDGTYEIPGVAVRANQVRTARAITRDGRRTGTAQFDLSFPGQIREGVVITLSGLGTLEFTVQDASGQPVAGQTVGLIGNCANACGCISATTDASGVAVFNDQSVGKHFAKAVLLGAGFVDLAEGSATISTNTATGRGVLQFGGVSTVTGRVLTPDDAPAQGADVSLRSRSFNFLGCDLRQSISHTIRTDLSGEFTFTGVNVGQVSVTATHPFFDANVGESGVLSTDAPLDFTLRLKDTTAGELSGTVYLPDGVTPAGAGVEITANGALPDVVVKTDANGHYAFAKIFPQGTYTVTARDPITGGVVQERIYLPAGEDFLHDMRLKGRGTVRVRVVDGADQPVTNAFVKLTETDFPGRLFEGAIEPSNQGEVVFENVFEGRFSVEAFDVFGRDGGRISSTLPGPDQTLALTVRLNAVGTVEGRFKMPGGAPIPFGVIKLISGGKVIGQTTARGSGDVGFFRFDYVAVGPVRIEAQDPLTARLGFAVGSLNEQDEVLQLDVVAQGLGTVRGEVTSNGVSQAGAHVDIVSGTFRACSIANDAGLYVFEGVPEGLVSATASLSNGFLQGTATGTLLGEAKTLVLDVALRSSSEMTGVVTPATGIGSAPPSLVTVRSGGIGGATQTTTTNALGEFGFARVPAGAATVTVDVLENIDRAKVTVDVPEAGTIQLPITLNGIGSISGTVSDTSAVPTTKRLTLTGSGDFGYNLVLIPNADGTYIVPEVLAGPVTGLLKATGADFTLFGTAAGVVEPDENLVLDVTTEPSGAVSGSVLRADGAPAAGANVTIKLSGGRGKVTLQAQNDGAFSALGVPLGEFSIQVEDSFTGGVGALDGLSLDTDGQLIENLVIELDEKPISVVTVDPIDGTTEVPVNTPVRLTFSDPVQSLNNAVRLFKGASPVSTTAELAPDRLSVTLTATSDLPHTSEFTVSVSTALIDELGRHPQEAFVSTFRTVDLTPPRVTVTVPPAGAVEVSVNTPVEVSFDEPLNDATDFDTLVRMLGPTGAVPGVSERTAVDAARFTPAAPLVENSLYQIVVTGAMDALGNITVDPVTVATFATPDNVPPQLTVIGLPTTGWTKVARPAVRFTLSDNLSGIDPTTGSADIDGVLVAPDAVSTVPTQLTVTPLVDLTEEMHTFVARIADFGGNVGVSAEASVGVDVSPPQAGELPGLSAGQVLSGVVSMVPTAADAISGIASIEILSDGSRVATALAPDFDASVNTALRSDGPHLFTARATDLAGNTGPEGAGVEIVVNNKVLTTGFVAPPPDGSFATAVSVEVSASETIDHVEITLGSDTVIDDTAPYEAVFDLASVDEGVQTISLLAVGFAGETATGSVDIVVDRAAPAAPVLGQMTTEPPDVDGASLLFGRETTVEALARVRVHNPARAQSATTFAGADGLFALLIEASIGDLLEVVAIDAAGNESSPTSIAVSGTPSLPAPEPVDDFVSGLTRADRVGAGFANLGPDGSNDAVFSVRVSFPDGQPRDLVFVDVKGPQVRSTRPEAEAVLGVAETATGPLLNAANGTVRQVVASDAGLSLFAAAEGFLAEQETYTVRLFFSDGTRLEGTSRRETSASLTQWTHERLAENLWIVADDGRSVVTDSTTNGTTYFVSPYDVFNTTVRGTMIVETTGDDDTIGFVFGYQAPLHLEGDAFDEWDLILFSWKQSRQTFSGTLRDEGFGMSRVQGDVTDYTPEVLGHLDSPVSEVLGTSFGPDKGWVDFQEHRFELEYFSDHIRIFIDDELIFDVTGTFQPGRFGFFNWSQAHTRYRMFIDPSQSDTTAPVLSLVDPSASGWTSSPRPTLRVALTDDLSGVAPGTLTLSLDGEPIVPDSVTGIEATFTPAADLAPGSHTVSGMATDTASNIGAFSASFSVDLVPPGTAEVSGVSNGQILSGAVALGATAMDDASGVGSIELLVNGAPKLTLFAPGFEGVLDTSAFADGQYLLTARAVDVAGNVGPEGPSVNVAFDNQALQVTIQQPSVNSRHRDSVLVKAVATESLERIDFELEGQTVSDDTAPYEATFDLAAVGDGVRTITATGFGVDGSSNAISRDIVVDRTPPDPPNAALIVADPPQVSVSFVFGSAGAVEANAVVDVVHTVTGQRASVTAQSDGSFFLSIPAAIGDALSITATDDLGNVSDARIITVSDTPTIPPSEDATRLRFDGLLVDRVGPGEADLAPDGFDDAVFTLTLDIGDGTTRDLEFIDLEGPQLRSTRPEEASVLGVASSLGGALLNNADGTVTFPVTTGASLVLFAADEGLIVEGETYTVTVGFTDGARFVGDFTIVPRFDQAMVAHSMQMHITPETLVVEGGFPAIGVIELTDIRDIEGAPVPDGAKLAIAVADMASVGPRASPIRSAGGAILDGVPAANHADFRVFTVSGGAVTATYETGAIAPVPNAGALAVVQVLAADADDNILGNRAVATLDVNVSHGSDRAVIYPANAQLYGDGSGQETSFRIQLTDEFGIAVPDGTKVLVTAAFCGSRVNGACAASYGGEIRGGDSSPAGSNYRAFTVSGGAGEVTGTYAATTAVGVGAVQTAFIQALAATPSGVLSNGVTAIGTASVRLVGAAGAEIQLAPESVPAVFPVRPVQIRVHHVHSSLGNLVPDGSHFLLAVNFCGSRQSGQCTSSIGGTIVDGDSSPNGAQYKAFTLMFGEIAATYSTDGVLVPPGNVRDAAIQLMMAGTDRRFLDSEAVAVRAVRVLGPSNAVGSADPPSLLADAAMRVATVTFEPVLDAFGNKLPDGVNVIVAASHCAGRVDGSCTVSDGGQIVGGAPSTSGAAYRIFPIVDGAVVVQYSAENVTAAPGQVKGADVAIFGARADGRIADSEVFGLVRVDLPGMTSADIAANPTTLHADGQPWISTVTISNLRDAQGNPVPDGARVAVSASHCAARISGACVSSFGGTILGGEDGGSGAHYRYFEVTGGQVVVQYSTEGLAIASDERIAVVQVVAATPANAIVNVEALATVPIQLVAPESAVVAVDPMDLFGDGGARLSQIVVSELRDFGGLVIPDGAKVGLSARPCAARNIDSTCVESVGGEILTGGVSPGDGDPSNNNANFRVFSVASGEVHAVYSSEALTAGVNETKTVSVVVATSDGSGRILSVKPPLGIGTLHLHGTSSATPSGPTSLPQAGGEATVSFTGIKDSAGNTVPDGTLVAVTVGNCVTRDLASVCNESTRGTIIDGTPAVGNANFQLFTVTGGRIDVTYSTAGASLGTARVQVAPARADGTVNGITSLVGGVWAIDVTP